MTVRLVYETHSTSVDNEVGRATGWLGGRLSETGASRHGGSGPGDGDGIDLVVASDLDRAVETARMGRSSTRRLAGGLGVTLPDAPERRLEVEALQIQLIRLRGRNLRDREILDREARGVEQRDVPAAATPLRVAGEHAADVGDTVTGDGSGCYPGGKLAAVARLLPVVTEEIGAGELGHGDLGLARAVCAHHRHVLPVAKRALGIDEVAARGDGHHDVALECLSLG